MQQFQCTECLNTCKTQKHSIIKRHKKVSCNLQQSVSLRTQFKTDSATKPQRPRPSHVRAYFSPQRKRRASKKTMFLSNPKIQIASMIRESEAFVRGFLQIPKLEDVKTKLSCLASFKFQHLKMRKQSSLLYSIQLYSIQLYSTLLYSTLL